MSVWFLVVATNCESWSSVWQGALGFLVGSVVVVCRGWLVYGILVAQGVTLDV